MLGSGGMEKRENKASEGGDPKRRRRRRTILVAAVMVALIVVALGLWARWRPAKTFVPGPPGEDQLRVVTWNVGYFTTRHVKAARAADTDAIVAVLCQTNAHLIALEELGSKEQAEEIARGLGAGWNAHGTATGHPGQFLGALSRLPVLSAEQKEAGGKKMLGLCVQLGGGRKAFLLSMHAPLPLQDKTEALDYIRTGAGWTRERSEDVRIMAGDLNWNFRLTNDDAKTDDLYREIRSFCADGTAAIGPSFYAHTRIDHVFYAPEGLRVVASGCGIIDPPDRYLRVPGWRDHRPVVVTIRLPEGSLRGNADAETHRGAR